MSTFMRYGIACIATCVVLSSAHAVTYPYKLHEEQNIDTHQVRWIDLTIDAQGHGVLIDSWSNGKQTSGNTFYAIVVLVGKDGRVIYSDKQTKGLDGSAGGHAREGHVTTNFILSKQQLEDFDRVALKMGAMNCGMELSSFHCCDNGIEVGFSTRKCNVPAAPSRSHESQAR
jgi:hypothetical protein